MRVAGIDVFRGLSIILMVIFTMIQIFSSTLPDLLVHNKPASVHIGDFVLPMFIFASGMSLVFFHRKRKAKGRHGYALDVLERAGRLALIWIFLSPISSGEPFGMDEIMLNVLLFVMCSVVVGADWRLIAAIALIPVVGYLFLYSMGTLPDFSGALPGGYGYATVPFYLPVMLAGVLAGRSLDDGRWSGKTSMLFAICSVLSVALIFIVQPWKLDASPSFMALAVLFSLVVFRFVGHARNGFLEYLGQKPLRYWILMFVLIIIPLSFYVVMSGAGLSMGTAEAIFASLLCCMVMYIGSGFIDVAVSLFPRRDAA